MAALDAHLVDREAGLLRLLDPPLAARPAERRLHPGLSARRARERRPVLACRRLGADGPGRARRRRCRLSLLQLPQPGAPLAPCRARPGLCDRALRHGRRRLQRRRPTSAAAAGAGTPARRPGCIAPRSNRCSASSSTATSSSSGPACLPHWNEAEMVLGRDGKKLRVLFSRADDGLAGHGRRHAGDAARRTPALVDAADRGHRAASSSRLPAEPVDAASAQAGVSVG